MVNNLHLEKPRHAFDWLRLYCLYMEAFPPTERKPFAKIRSMYRQGRADVWCIMDSGKLLGLATTVNSEELILLDYFAVKRNSRGQGIGTAAMKLLLENYHDRGFFLEIESTFEDCPDREARLKRKHFYLSSGLTAMDTEAQVFGVRMELLGIRCHLDFADYQSFYRDNYSTWAAEHLHEP